jgi:Glycosyl hydrolase family 26
VSRRAFLAGSAVLAASATEAACAQSSSAGADTSSNDEPFFGLDVPFNDPNTVEKVGMLVGAKPSVVSLFCKLDSKIPATRLRQMAAKHQTAFITLEPWSLSSTPGMVGQDEYSLASIIRGDHDSNFRRIAAQLGALKHPIYLRFAHEMNAWWYPWCEAVNGNKPGQYVAAWKHVHSVISSATKLEINWVWSPNQLITTKRKLPSLGELYPGDDFTTYTGMTGYSHDDPSPHATFDATVKSLLKLSDRPILLSEIGAEGASRPHWIAGLPGYLHSEKRIRGFVYYETSPKTTGATGNYEIADSTASVAAFRKLLRSIGST